LRIGNFEHNPGALKTILFILFLAALLALGTWQMQRAAEKKGILAAAARAMAIEAVDVFDVTDLQEAARQHTLVTVSGTYVSNRQYLWDNRVHKGQAGFEVVTPVKTARGLVLVNRGWVAPGKTRNDLPDVALPDDLQTSTVTITGLFSRPSKGFLNGESFDTNAAWPRVLQYFDYAAIEQAVKEPVLGGVIQPQQVVDVTGTESGMTEEADRLEFFVANWEPAAAIGPTRHYGYAFQWYAMAVALVVLFIVYNTRRVEAVQ